MKDKLNYSKGIQKVCIEGIFTMLKNAIGEYMTDEELYYMAIQIEQERHEKND